MVFTSPKSWRAGRKNFKLWLAGGVVVVRGGGQNSYLGSFDGGHYTFNYIEGGGGDARKFLEGVGGWGKHFRPAIFQFCCTPFL